MGMRKDLGEENGQLRGLLGSGVPGLWTLLGGSAAELSADELRITGGSGQTSSVARIAQAHRDTRLNGVASGGSYGGSGRFEGREPGREGLPR